MHDIPIALVYLYILVRLFLFTKLKASTYNNDSRIVNFIKNILLSTKTFLIELIISGTLLNYIFNYLYIKNIDNNTSLIIPAEFVFTTFYTLVFLLGLAIAIKFTLNLTQQAHTQQSILFVSTLQYYEKIADTFLYSGLINIFLLYSILELSYIAQEANLAFLILLSILGFLISIVYLTHYNNIDKEVKKMVFVIHLFVLGLIVLMMNEANFTNITSIPLTASILIFHSTFLIGIIAKKLHLNLNLPNFMHFFRKFRKKEHMNEVFYTHSFQTPNITQQNQEFIPYQYQIYKEKVDNESTIPIKITRSNTTISLKQITNRY